VIWIFKKTSFYNSYIVKNGVTVIKKSNKNDIIYIIHCKKRDYITQI